MKETCIVSCCYSPQHAGHRYGDYADRLEHSLNRFSPNSDRIIWRKSWPPESPDHLSFNYAFKYYAVKEAFKQGYRYVMWLDAGTEAIAPVDKLWERTKRLGHTILRGADPLWKWISDAALKHFGYTRERAMTMTLCGGCIVGLDQQSELAMKFFEEWGKIVKIRPLLLGANRYNRQVGGIMRSIMLSDADRSVISEDERVEGHRSDESCFSLIIDKLGMEPLSYTEWLTVCKTY